MAHETILYHNEGWKIIKIENEALKAYNYIFDQMKYDKRQNGKSLISLVP